MKAKITSGVVMAALACAVAAAGSAVRVAWDKSPDDDPAAPFEYWIVMDGSPSVLTNVMHGDEEFRHNAGHGATNATIELPRSGKWYVVAFARTQEGVWSEPSNMIEFTAPSAPAGLQLVPLVVDPAAQSGNQP